MITVSVFSISRHRLSTDGEGVTTLVAFHGCPLRCRYCLNAQCLYTQTPIKEVTVQDLIDELMIDNLYFVATGGGVTFGGGEPLLRSDFIRSFCEQCPKEWNIYLETSLNVPLPYLQAVAPFIHTFYIDIKDMNPDIYKRYTSRDNHHVLENLQWLSTQPSIVEKTVIRVPEIPNYNTKCDTEQSYNKLKAMGFSRFDFFEYYVSRRAKLSL